jgi:hypothetical protein
MNQHYENHWTGRRGAIHWPPRSPDLTQLHFLLWSVMQEMTDRTKEHTREELLHRTTDAAAYMRYTPKLFNWQETFVWNEQGCALKTVADRTIARSTS